MSVSITYPDIKVNLRKFAGGELHVQLQNLSEVAPEKVDIQANIHSSDDLMALLLIHNALQNHYGKDLIINVEIPYFPYARQDRVCAVGQAFSMQVVATMVNGLDLNSLTVWDAHSPITQELTKAINIPQEMIIEVSDQLIQQLQADDTVLVCPDKGARNKCLAVKETFSVKEMIYAEKVRDAGSGEIVDTDLLSGDLSAKTAVIIDDICDGGRTFIEIAKKLKEKNVKRVVLYVTHGIFSKGLEVFDELIDEIYTSNSFPQLEKPKLNVINFLTSNRRSA